MVKKGQTEDIGVLYLRKFINRDLLAHWMMLSPDFEFFCTRCNDKKFVKSIGEFQAFDKAHRKCKKPIDQRYKHYGRPTYATRYKCPFTGRPQRKHSCSHSLTITARMYYDNILGGNDGLEKLAQSYFKEMADQGEIPEYGAHYGLLDQLEQSRSYQQLTPALDRELRAKRNQINEHIQPG